jgi:hypothetical protein
MLFTCQEMRDWETPVDQSLLPLLPVNFLRKTRRLRAQYEKNGPFDGQLMFLFRTARADAWMAKQLYLTKNNLKFV